jgi:single-strand DNA-binding protein
MNETIVTVVGTVITDVRQRTTQDGVALASFRVACNERRYDKASGEWVDGDRLYLSVTCWRKVAVNVGAALDKGDPVVVRGRLFSRGYEQDGVKRTALDLDAYQVAPDLARCAVTVHRSSRAPAAELALAEDLPAPRGAEPDDGAREPAGRRPALAVAGSGKG